MSSSGAEDPKPAEPRAPDSSLGSRLEVTLSDLYTPGRTRSGEVATRLNRPRYGLADHVDFTSTVLGLSCSEAALLAVRKGEAPATLVEIASRRAVRRIEAGEPVELLVRRDKFRQAARSGLSFFRSFGYAPDGDTSIRAWLDRLAIRVDAVDVSLLELGSELDTVEGH